MPEQYLITQDDFLYRRFPIDNPIFWKFQNDRKVPTSAAFKTKPGENGLSVDIAALTTPEKSVMNSARFNLAEISAATPLNLNLECVHNPVPENDAHALILGENTKSIAKKLSVAVTNIYQF
jgi:hypothetical protein